MDFILIPHFTIISNKIFKFPLPYLDLTKNSISFLLVFVKNLKNKIVSEHLVYSSPPGQLNLFSSNILTLKHIMLHTFNANHQNLPPVHYCARQTEFTNEMYLSTNAQCVILQWIHIIRTYICLRSMDERI
jgi:hypothetical protein